jgi:hypothetical protein
VLTKVDLSHFVYSQRTSGEKRGSVKIDTVFADKLIEPSSGNLR